MKKAKKSPPAKTAPLKICLVGAESTGKTTLAQQLAQHFKTNWAPEYGRIYSEGKINLPTYADNWTTEEFIHIATVQRDLIGQLLFTAEKYLFIDTDAFATGVWHQVFMGFASPEVDEIGKQSMADYYFVMKPDVEFVRDGVRNAEDQRGWMHKEFIRQLEARGARYSVISGPFQTRFQQALEFIEKETR